MAPSSPAVRSTPPAAHSERKHAPFGCSNSKAWLACGQWYKRTKDIPERPAGKDAAWGTAAHEKAEKCLRAHGRLPETDEHACVVNPYLDYVVQRQKETGGQLMVETRVDVEGPHCWGSLDAAIVDSVLQQIEVIDLKGGQGVSVDAEENTQGGLYGIGLLFKVEPDVAKWADWNIRVTIVQPRVYDAPQSWDTTGAALALLLKEARKAIKRHLDPADTTPAKTGDHCRFCSARTLNCPDQIATAAEVFPDLPVAVETGCVMQMPVEPRTLSPEQVANVVRLAPQITAYIKAVLALALTAPPPGFKVVEGRANRAWKDPADAGLALELAGVDEPWKKEPIGLTDARKKLIAAGLTAAAADGVIAPLTVKPRGKPKLVPADDKRPAITVNPGDVFPDEEDEA